MVLGSPSLLPRVCEVLECDSNLVFSNDPDGWFLMDGAGGGMYRAPTDGCENPDFTYVGRLPRPDGRGTFLYLGGIHPIGTLGAARWLASNVDEVSREVESRWWSTLVETCYDEATRAITSTTRLTRIYQHGGPP